MTDDAERAYFFNDNAADAIFLFRVNNIADNVASIPAAAAKRNALTGDIIIVTPLRFKWLYGLKFNRFWTAGIQRFTVQLNRYAHAREVQ